MNKIIILLLLGLFLYGNSILGQTKNELNQNSFNCPPDRYLTNKMLHTDVQVRSKKETFYKLNNSIYSSKPKNTTGFEIVKLKVTYTYEVNTAVDAKGSCCDKRRIGKRIISITPDFPKYPQ